MTAEFLITGPQDGAIFVFAHGAGAGMDSEFMELIACGLAAQDIGVVRFEFPYMSTVRETGRRRPPDRMPVLVAHFKQVIEEFGHSKQLVIGGKSMGGRVASHVATELDVAGLVCLGYPFHPRGKPQQLRTAHLPDVGCPGLILQGERDPFGKRSEVDRYDLPERLVVRWLADGDHDLKPRSRSGLTKGQQLEFAIAEIRGFIEAL